MGLFVRRKPRVALATSEFSPKAKTGLILRVSAAQAASQVSPKAKTGLTAAFSPSQKPRLDAAFLSPINAWRFSSIPNSCRTTR